MSSEATILPSTHDQTKVGVLEVGAKNGLKNNSKTGFSLNKILNIFFNWKHCYFKTIISQDLPIIVAIVRSGLRRSWGKNDHYYNKEMNNSNFLPQHKVVSSENTSGSTAS